MQDSSGAKTKLSEKYGAKNIETGVMIAGLGFDYEPTMYLTVVTLKEGPKWRAVPVNFMSYTRMDYPPYKGSHVEWAERCFVVSEKSRRGIATNKPVGYYMGKAKIDRHDLSGTSAAKRCSLRESEVTGTGEWLMISPMSVTYDVLDRLEGIIFIPEHAVEDIERAGTRNDVRFRKPKVNLHEQEPL